MKTVYLCGGINGLTDAQCNDWRAHAKQHLNAHTLDPMRRDYRGREAESVNEIVYGDIDDIHASDIVLVNAMRPSWGTAMEIVYAFKCGRRIVSVAQEPISPWLRFHSTRIFPTLAEAIECINSGFRL